MSHRKTMGFPLRMLGAFALLGAAGLGHAEQITHYTYGSGKIDQWFISEPTVNSPGGRFYPEILFRPGDTILVSAGGCVQTGGRGLTWKRYVDPQGPNSDRLYHGLVGGLPFANTMRMLDFMNSYHGTYVAPPGNYFTEFFLGYEDDGYGDNGYYSHDNGTGDQCLNVGNAWVTVTVFHP